LFGKTRVGYFWLCEDRLIYKSEQINLDKVHSTDEGIISPKTTKEIVWKELSEKKFNGKYASYNSEYFCNGQIVYDTTTQWSQIRFSTYECGKVELFWGIGRPKEYYYTENNKKIKFDAHKVKKAFNISSADIIIDE
jgi:hypothetical protein